MPIHDQSYRRYRGARESVQRVWSVITLFGLRTVGRRRVFWGLMLLAWMPFFFRAVQMYGAATLPQFSALAPTAETYRHFLEQQNFFLLVITIYVGSGLIANDRRANALQLYLSKPLTRVDYVAGKAAVLLPLLLLVTWIPSLVLLLLQGIFAGSFSFLVANFFVVPAVTVLAWIQCLVATFAMLALSSLSRSSRFAGVLYAGIVMFSDAYFGAVRLITRTTWWSWISVPASIAQLGDGVFRITPRYETPVIGSLLVVVTVVALSLWVLERRVRAVEVVG